MQQVRRIAKVAVLVAATFLDLKKSPLTENQVRGTNELQAIINIINGIEKQVEIEGEGIIERIRTSVRIDTRRSFNYPDIMCPEQRSANIDEAVRMINQRFGVEIRGARESEYTKEELESVGNYFSDELLKTRLRECPPRIIILDTINDPQELQRLSRVFGEYLSGSDVIILDREHSQDKRTRIHELVHYADRMLTRVRFRLERGVEYYIVPSRLNEGITELFTYRITGQTYREINENTFGQEGEFTWRYTEIESTYPNELREALILEAVVGGPTLRYAVGTGDWSVVERAFDRVFGEGEFVRLLNSHYQEQRETECRQVNMLQRAIMRLRRIRDPTTMQINAIARLNELRDSRIWLETTTHCRE